MPSFDLHQTSVFHYKLGQADELKSIGKRTVITFSRIFRSIDSVQILPSSLSRNHAQNFRNSRLRFTWIQIPGLDHIRQDQMVRSPCLILIAFVLLQHWFRAHLLFWGVKNWKKNLYRIVRKRFGLKYYHYTILQKRNCKRKLKYVAPDANSRMYLDMWCRLNTNWTMQLKTSIRKFSHKSIGWIMNRIHRWTNHIRSGAHFQPAFSVL